MTDNNPPAPLRENDFDVIEAAVMETEKGRWFLAEYARRHRAADTVTVLSAIEGLERLLKRERRPDADRIRLDVAEMKDAIERTKSEIAGVKLDGGDESRFERATNELDAIVVQTEAATSEILGAAEKLQEVSFVMREGGVDGEICDSVEQLVMTIYTACSFQDLTGQRTQKVVHVLRYLESRIDAMIDIWGMDGPEVSAAAGATTGHQDLRPDAHLLNGPALQGEGIDQAGVDDLMDAVPAASSASLDSDTAADLGTGQSDDDFLAQPVVDADEADWTEASRAADVPSSAEIADDAGTATDTGAPFPDESVWDAAPADPAEEPPSAEVDGQAELSPVDQGDTTLDAEPILDDAEAAIDSAIDALREVSAAAGQRDAGDDASDPPAADAADEADPWDVLSRAERLALFS